MRKSFPVKLGFMLLLIFLVGCGSGSTSTSGGTGSIAAKLEWGTGKSSSIASSLLEFFGIHSASAPPGVVTVRIIVTGPDMSGIQKDFPASDGKGLIEGVPAGNNRTVTAQGLDSGGNVAYHGLKGNIAVVSGQTTDIGTITMLPFGAGCLDLVNQGNMLEAKAACVSAADAYGDTASNDADTVRFFAAFSRIASLYYNMSSDGNPNNGLNTFGDILDAFGCNTSGRDPITFVDQVRFSATPYCPVPLPAGAPTGAQLQTFIANVIRPELEGAIANLGKVSQSFNVTWTEPFGGKQVISDYGDALALRALSASLLGSAIAENSYNLDADIATAANTKQTKQDFLASNPNFLTLRSTSELGTVQSLLGNASDDTLAAINWIQSRTGSQSSYFISLGNMTSSEIDKHKREINEFKASLTGPSNIHGGTGTLEGTLDLTKFFAGMNLRSLLPTYTGSIPGFFPDPTFNGAWTNYVPGSQYDPNRDLNMDGVPDVLRKNLSLTQNAAHKSKSVKGSRSPRG
jgi:hypothetical protein